MSIAQAFQPTFSPAPLVKSDETFTRANREFSLSERFAPYSKLSLPVFLPLSLPTTLLSLFLSIFPHRNMRVLLVHFLATQNVLVCDKCLQVSANLK